MTAIILKFPSRGPSAVRVEPEAGGECWLVIARSHGWLHGDFSAALQDARSIASGFSVAVASTAWRNA
jgi:hypothetical protein